MHSIDPERDGMSAPELAIQFECAGESLLGIVSPSAPAKPASDLGVVIVVGGPQYRVGSHRQFVQLARAVSQAGHAALRFDYRGMGDSGGALHNFEQVDADIAAAISALMSAQPALRRVVLWGLCDGASAALLYLDQQADPRVAGLCLVNPWVRSEAGLARTHVKHYYLQRLREGAFWRKLASGQVALAALTGLWRNLRAAMGHSAGPKATAASFQQRMATAWARFEGPRLLLLSENDLTAQEFIDTTTSDAQWQQAMSLRPPQRVTLSGADHTCSSSESQRALEAATLRWLADMSIA